MQYASDRGDFHPLHRGRLMLRFDGEIRWTLAGSPLTERVNDWVPTRPRCIPCTDAQIQILETSLSVVKLVVR
jgi:hypothetical protein